MNEKVHSGSNGNRTQDRTEEYTMTVQDFVRAAAGVLAGAVIAGGAIAQTTQTKEPEPVTMTDTAPNPAGDRGSVGAVILSDQPVPAQREAQQQTRSAVDTRAMGAGPNRIPPQRAVTKDEVEFQRALDAAMRRHGTPQ
jgi:hypothetical protein